MACRECDGTMQGIVTDGPVKVWQCPRCGTVKQQVGDRVEWDVPKLIFRCRTFETQILAHGLVREWVADGLAEAVRVPGERLE